METPVALLDPGRFLGDRRFEILRHLGSGGMGVVYLAYDRERRTEVALKTLRHFEPAALYRFKREFRSLSDVIHPNLVALYELVSEGDLWFFTMEYIDGTSFIHYVRPRSDPSTAPTATSTPSYAATPPPNSTTCDMPLDPPREATSACTLPQLDRLRAALSQLAQGVSALHGAGRLHRDLKPSNVLVTPAGRVVILDFGLATELGKGAEGLSADRVVGTAAYMSPEQGAGIPLTEASDWYSLGVMLFEALTGRRPFVGGFTELLIEKQRVEPPSPCDLIPDVPHDLDSLTRELLRRLPERRPAGRMVLRRLGSAAAALSPAAVTPAPAAGASLLVGRTQHLERLRNGLRMTREGRAMAVLVRGRSGMGKSALVQAFLEGLAPAEAVVLAGRCYEREAVPYKALDTVVDELSKFLVHLPVQEAAALMPRDCGALARLFPVLNRVRAVADAPRRQVQVPDPQELRRRAFAALRELFVRLGDRRTLIVYVDDLQWGDLDSAALLTELLRPPNPPALFLIVCCRAEDIEAVPLLRSLLDDFRSGRIVADVAEIEVGPLSATDATEMALSLLNASDSPARTAAERIAEESGGNPFFVAELIRYARTSDPAAGPTTPEGGISLDDALQARILRLPEDARALLTAVAVAGRPVPTAVASQAANVEVQNQTALAALRAGHLIKTRAGRLPQELEAYHDRIRESAVALLDDETLRGFHRRLALALEESPAPDHDALALHFRAAEITDRAAAHSAIAADAATKALAFDRAARLYRWAIELRPETAPERRSLWSSLGLALACAGRGLEAAHAYEEAAKGATGAESLEYRRLSAEQLLRSGHVDEGLAALDTVLSAVGMHLSKTPRGALVSILLRRAILAVRGLGFTARDPGNVSPYALTQIDVCWAVVIGLARIDNIRAADFQTRHLLLTLRAGEPYRIARALATEAGFSSTGGDRTRRRTYRFVNAASDLAAKLDHPHALGLATFAAGLAAYYQGLFPAARDHCEEAETIFRERCTGVAWEINTSAAFSLSSLFYLGEARELAQRAPLRLAEARDRGDRYAAVDFAAGRSAVAWLVGDDVTRARQEISEAMDRWSRRGFHAQHFLALFALVQLELYIGDGVTAWHMVDERWPEIAPSLILRVRFNRVEILGMRARSALAVAAASDRSRGDFLKTAESDARRIAREKLAFARPLASLLLAGAAGLRGETDRAVGNLDLAIEEFDRLAMALFAAAARWRKGQLLGGGSGRDLKAAAEAYMHSQAIMRPDRIVAMLAPGFPD